MRIYDIIIDGYSYFGIEAEDENEAIEIAMDLHSEHEPSIEVEDKGEIERTILVDKNKLGDLLEAVSCKSCPLQEECNENIICRYDLLKYLAAEPKNSINESKLLEVIDWASTMNGCTDCPCLAGCNCADDNVCAKRLLEYIRS